MALVLRVAVLQQLLVRRWQKGGLGLLILVQDDDAVCNHPRLFGWWRVCLHSEGRKASCALLKRNRNEKV